jgi:uncharacterized protein YjiS (DUF1127 family)
VPFVTYFQEKTTCSNNIYKTETDKMIITATSNIAFPTTKSVSIMNLISSARAVSKQRRALAGLSSSQLSDIGMTPAQRTTECNRRFWQRG